MSTSVYLHRLFVNMLTFTSQTFIIVVKLTQDRGQSHVSANPNKLSFVQIMVSKLARSSSPLNKFNKFASYLALTRPASPFTFKDKVLFIVKA